MSKKGTFSKACPLPNPSPRGGGAIFGGYCVPSTRQRASPFEPNEVFQQTKRPCFHRGVLLYFVFFTVHLKEQNLDALLTSNMLLFRILVKSRKR